jgi:hypothetical protein
MNRLVIAAPLAAGIIALGACANGGLFGSGTPQYTAGGTYEAYYDGAYGQIYDGYWTGGTFNFRTAPNQKFQHDVKGHFRRDAASGFTLIQGEMHPGLPTGSPPSVTQPQQ